MPKKANVPAVANEETKKAEASQKKNREIAEPKKKAEKKSKDETAKASSKAKSSDIKNSGNASGSKKNKLKEPQPKEKESTVKKSQEKETSDIPKSNESEQLSYDVHSIFSNPIFSTHSAASSDQGNGVSEIANGDSDPLLDLQLDDEETESATEELNALLDLQLDDEEEADFSNPGQLFNPITVESGSDIDQADKAIAESENEAKSDDDTLSFITHEDAEENADSDQNATDEPRFMNIEHFSDYHSKEFEPSDEGIEKTVSHDDTKSNEQNLEEEQKDVPLHSNSGDEYQQTIFLDSNDDDADTPEESIEKDLPLPEAKFISDEKEYDPKAPRKVDMRFDFVELFVFTLAAVLVIMTFFFKHSVVEGSSMEQTLHEGEHLIISDFFYTPETGDIIVCEDYSTGHLKPLVKRVIATGGQTVRIDPYGNVYVDGELLEEDYVYIDGYMENIPLFYSVPEGEVFVMGDHRNLSSDSRAFGTVSENSILGKVLLRFYPFDKFGTVD